VVLRLVIDFTVSPDGHYSTDYYDHSAPPRDIGYSAGLPSIKRGPHVGSGVARIAIYPPT